MVPRPPLADLTRAAAIALSLATAAAACSSRRPSSPAPPAANVTRVFTFQAFDDRGLLPGLVDRGTVNGACPGGSLADPGRADAWRCAAGDTVLDPCFANPGGGDLACVADPVGREVRRLVPAGPLAPGRGNRNDPGRPPWFLELTDGSRCAATPGATDDVVAGRRRTYACTGGADVYGEPDGSRPLWTVQVRSPGATDLVPTDVDVAWY